MKATGIVRRVDELGRVVLPIELRKSMDIKERDAMEIFTEGDQIILKKYEPACIFSGNTEDLIEYNGRKISKNIIKELAVLAKL
jgi:transcriptional pleiotropic regulator of transition state genes